MQKLLMCTALCIGISMSAIAQVPVRKDDHFYSKRVVNRISLVEKINRPLVHHESNLYGDNPTFKEQNGLVASLINGLKSGDYLAFHPDNWEQTINYDQLVDRMKEFDAAIEMKYEGAAWDEDAKPDEVFGAGEEEIWADEAKTDNWEDSQWEDDNWEEDIVAEEETPQDQPYQMDLAPYEEVIHMVEDRVFDKNRSMMVNQVDFFEIIWVDPSGALPEKVLARFKWKDVQEQLRDTKWKTRANDATDLSIAHAIEMRMFHSFLINVGGKGVRTLWEAETRREELIEFEHHLWSY